MKICYNKMKLSIHKRYILLQMVMLEKSPPFQQQYKNQVVTFFTLLFYASPSRNTNLSCHYQNVEKECVSNIECFTTNLNWICVREHLIIQHLIIRYGQQQQTDWLNNYSGFFTLYWNALKESTLKWPGRRRWKSMQKYVDSQFYVVCSFVMVVKKSEVDDNVQHQVIPTFGMKAFVI